MTAPLATDLETVSGNGSIPDRAKGCAQDSTSGAGNTEAGSPRVAARDTIGPQIVYDLDNLRHMLGIRCGTHKRDYGYRNYFNSTEAGPDHESMLRLLGMGLVRSGLRCYWHATEAGCKAVGLDEKQTRRALNDD
jgi:hypothetical protein